MYFLSIVAQFREENNWLEEFILYHQAVGVEHFYLVCDDDNPRVANAILKKYVDKGLVTLYYTRDLFEQDWDFEDWRQNRCYHGMVLEVMGKTEWCGFIDLDEFMMPRTCDDIRQEIDKCVVDDSVGGIAMNWSIYGSGGYIKRPPTQINHFLYRPPLDHGLNGWIKSIIKPNKVFLRHMLPDVHLFPMIDGYRTVDQNGNTVNKVVNPLAIDHIRLNHYIIRSYQDFWEVKAKRARNTIAGSPVCDEQFFKDRDLNMEFDDEISRRFGKSIESLW